MIRTRALPPPETRWWQCAVPFLSKRGGAVREEIGRGWRLSKRALLTGILIAFTLWAASAGWFYLRFQHRHEGQYFDSNGVQIHYTDEGAGEPVILVHGFGVNADINWRRPGIIKALAPTYRVIALDVRGHGLSGKPHDPARYGVEMARDVVRLMDHLRIPKAHVVGYSMGGFITLKMVTLCPERLLSAAPCGAGWEKLEDRGLFRERLAESLERNEGYGPLFQMLDPNGKGPGWLRLKLTNAALNSINDRLALAAVMRSLGDLTVSEESLRANRVPVLTVVGGKDPLRLGVDRMRGVMANQEIVYIDGANHLSALESPELIEQLKAFLARHTQALRSETRCPPLTQMKPTSAAPWECGGCPQLS